jgi:hypothetical protein
MPAPTVVTPPALSHKGSNGSSHRRPPVERPQKLPAFPPSC